MATNHRYLVKMARESDRARLRQLQRNLGKARELRRTARARARAACLAARDRVNVWAAAERVRVRDEIARMRANLRAGIKGARDEVRATCSAGRLAADLETAGALTTARQALADERTMRRYSRDTGRRDPRYREDEAKRIAARKRAEQRGESDDQVRGDLSSGDEVIIFNAVKSRIKATERASRLEVFQEWLAEHQGEAAKILEKHYAADVERLIKEERKQREHMQTVDYNASSDVALSEHIARVSNAPPAKPAKPKKTRTQQARPAKKKAARKRPSVAAVRGPSMRPAAALERDEALPVAVGFASSAPRSSSRPPPRVPTIPPPPRLPSSPPRRATTRPPPPKAPSVAPRKKAREPQAAKLAVLKLSSPAAKQPVSFATPWVLEDQRLGRLAYDERGLTYSRGDRLVHIYEEHSGDRYLSEWRDGQRWHLPRGKKEATPADLLRWCFIATERGGNVFDADAKVPPPLSKLKKRETREKDPHRTWGWQVTWDPTEERGKYDRADAREPCALVLTRTHGQPDVIELIGKNHRGNKGVWALGSPDDLTMDSLADRAIHAMQRPSDASYGGEVPF